MNKFYFTSSMLGVAFLGLWSMGFSCDFDNDGDCDFEIDHDCDMEREGQNNPYLSEEEYDKILYDSLWCDKFPITKKDKNLKTERELKKIRRKAFLFKKKKIKVGYGSKELINKNVISAVDFLKNQAFINVKTVPITDIGLGSTIKDGSVKEINIDGSSFFLKSDMFAYDSEIIIYYHQKKRIAFPYSRKDIKKKNYQGIVNELKRIGFTNIVLKPKNNLIFGIFSAEDKIEKITVGQSDKFEKMSLYPFDVEIVVEYNSF